MTDNYEWKTTVEKDGPSYVEVARENIKNLYENTLPQVRQDLENAMTELPKWALEEIRDHKVIPDHRCIYAEIGARIVLARVHPLLEALGFYSNPDSWGNRVGQTEWLPSEIQDNYAVFERGRRARKALAQWHASEPRAEEE